MVGFASDRWSETALRLALVVVGANLVDTAYDDASADQADRERLLCESGSHGVWAVENGSLGLLLLAFFLFPKMSACILRGLSSR